MTIQYSWIHILSIIIITLTDYPSLGYSRNSSENEQQEGFVSLFNGKDLSGWRVTGKAQGFGVENGVIVNYAQGGGYLQSEKKYENFILRLEYKISPKGNSGIYIHASEYGRQSRVGGEIQIFDSFGKELTPYSAGALYDIAAPKVNAARPAEAWNELEIHFVWPQLQVVLNGTEVIHVDHSQDERLQWRNRTGYIGLQDHGNPVWFRNIRIKDLGGKDESEWIPLFNGHDLSGFQIIGDAAWKAEEGILRAENGSGYAVTQQKFKNFQLWVYIRTSSKAVGSIAFRWNRPADRGYEARIYNDEKDKSMTGSIVDLTSAEKLFSKDEQWFPMEIIARGARLLIIVNGKIIAETDQAVEREGKIALHIQSPHGVIQFQDIRIKPL